MRPVGFISSEIREGGVRGGRDHRISKIMEGWRMTGSAGTAKGVTFFCYLKGGGLGEGVCQVALGFRPADFSGGLKT